MTFEKEYNGRNIVFSSDVDKLRELYEDNQPFVLLINNENRFEDVAFARYAIDIENFDPFAYDDEGEFIESEEEESATLSEEEILAIADDEYCRILLARFDGKPVVISETDKCKIRELSVDDVMPLMNLYNDVKPTFLEKFFDTIDDAREYITKYIDQVYGFYNYGIWGIYLDEGGQDKLIGLVGFTPRQARRKCAEDEDQFAGFDAVINLELGFAVDEKYRRQGYGFAAASAAINYAKDHIEHHAIFVNIDPSNQPAIGLAKKLGLME